MAKNFPLSLYYSVTKGATPNVTDLDRGTPAFNIVDKKMFLRAATEDTANSPEQDTLLTFDLAKVYTLGDMSDVLLAGATTNQVLSFNGTKWVNATITASMITDFVDEVKKVVGMDNAGLVHTKGDETIEGTKTFTVAPLCTAEQAIASAGENEFTKISVTKAQTIYTDKSPNGATVAIGGIPKGKKYSNANVIDVINDLLHPYVAPSNVRLTLAGVNGGVFEKGSTQNVTGATVAWNAGSQTVTKAEVLAGGSPVATQSVDSDTGSQAVTLTQAVKTDTTFAARVTDATKTTQGGNVSFTFVYPMYQGVIANGAEVNEAAVKGLTKMVKTKGTQTISYTTQDAQQVVFAFPKAYGSLRSVLDPNNFECLDTFTKKEVSITGLDSTAQAYNVYVVTTNVQNFAYKFAF